MCICISLSILTSDLHEDHLSNSHFLLRDDSTGTFYVQILSWIKSKNYANIPPAEHERWLARILYVPLYIFLFSTAAATAAAKMSISTQHKDKKANRFKRKKMYQEKQIQLKSLKAKG